jgi:hypothetical protein
MRVRIGSSPWCGVSVLPTVSGCVLPLLELYPFELP